MENTQIGKRIQEARMKSGLSLDEVAKSIDVNKSTVMRYENGRIQNIKLPVIEAIAKKLNVAPDWLLCKSDVMERVSSEEELDYIIDQIQSRDELLELFRIAASAKKEDIEKLITVFRTFVGEI